MMRIKKTLCATLSVIVFAVWALPASANSLWVDDGNLFSDRKASAIGDTLLVKVSEVIDDTDESKAKSSKTTNDDVRSGFGILSFIKAFGFGASSSYNSNTKLERAKNLKMAISCLVVDVMPNGNLVIQGDRILTNGPEKMNARFSGVVRPQDIAHDNTVESARVANAEMVVSGKGIVSRTKRPGIITQILQAIF